MKVLFIPSRAEFNGCSLNHCYGFKINVGFNLRTFQHSATLACVGFTEPPSGWRLFCSVFYDNAPLTAVVALKGGKMSGRCFFIIIRRRRSRTAYRVPRLPAATRMLHPHYITATAALIFAVCCSRKAPITTGVSFILEHGFN